MPDYTQGDQVRELIGSAQHEVAIIAPFIKVDALKSLLDAIPPDIKLRCVTRWLPREVAMGISDTEILDLLNERGNSKLSLVDKLHAKFYISDRQCLVGSSNVTLSGLGESGERSNIEVLIETTTDNDNVASVLDLISQLEHPATKDIADSVQSLAKNLSNIKLPNANAIWFPTSRRPQDAYSFYMNPRMGNQHMTSVNLALLEDVANSNLQPGLSEDEFKVEIRALLRALPISRPILNSDTDSRLSINDVDDYLNTLQLEGFDNKDLWQAFISWMEYFFGDMVMTQEVSEVVLRRAQRLD